MSIETIIEEHTETQEELGHPDDFRVLLLNDDYTTMDFVVFVLVSIFHKSLPDATGIMLDVHKKGRGMVGVYSYDIAVTKVNQVHALARERQFPLRCVVEKI
jgi:ATP-dependent Clp protease adaptor protein ClpS